MKTSLASFADEPLPATVSLSSACLGLPAKGNQLNFSMSRGDRQEIEEVKQVER